MRICLVYDCLFPHTVGGAERWYRSLAERLAAEGHEVTYLTLRQWERGTDPGLPGVDVRAVGPRMGLYVGGRRRILPPVVFGVGVFAHLLARGGRYDVVHTCSFPYFSLLAAGLVRPVRRFGLVVDWFEVWSAHYWREYLGGVGGRVGETVQRLCAHIPQRAYCFSRLHRTRLREEGFKGEIELLTGAYTGTLEPAEPLPAELLVVFAGRHIPEKRAPAVVAAIGAARRQIPELRGLVLGDGPDRGLVLEAIEREGLHGVVEAPGFVGADVVDDAIARALCLVLPSEREGYGMVVAEASAHGTPAVVVLAPDNAAVELVEEGQNGTVATGIAPAELAAAIVRVHQAGPALRERTRVWWAQNSARLSVADSLDRVVAAYDAIARR